MGINNKGHQQGQEETRRTRKKRVWEKFINWGTKPQTKEKKRLREEGWGVWRCCELGFFYSNGYKRGWEEREKERKKEEKE